MSANWLICFALVVSTIHVVECKSSGSKSRSRHGSVGSSRGTHSSHGSSGGSSRGSSRSGDVLVRSPPSQKSPVFPQDTGGMHGYPPSPGISGSETKQRLKPSTGTGGTHGYPPSPGISGLGKQQTLKPSSHGSSGGSSRGSSQEHGSALPYPKSRHTGGGTVYQAPSYYSSPQHVYVEQYRYSGSRYDNILTGLTMYNLGRSHSHHHHYYHDSYYRDSMAPRTESGYPEDTTDDPNEAATCFLKMRKNRHEEVVKVPCAIVSTFSVENNVTSDMNQYNVPSVQNCSSVEMNRLDENNTLNNNFNCVNSTTKVEDPLSMKGESIDAENMECLVEIRTKENVIQNNVDCKILLKYAKIPVPEKKVNAVLPRRETLKAMVDNPPWWLSLFIVV